MTSHAQPEAVTPPGRRLSLDAPIPLLVGLALLALPRAVLHDLGVLSEATLVNGLFVVVPLLIWIAVVLWRRVATPFLTLLVVGAVYGILLTVTHQLLWNIGFDGTPPRLGGNLATVDPVVQEIVTRSFAAVSSLFTGVMVGAVTGLVAWLLRPLWQSARPAGPVTDSAPPNGDRLA